MNIVSIPPLVERWLYCNHLVRLSVSPSVHPFTLSYRYFSFYWKKWLHIYFLFTVRLTNERVGVFLARRSVQHLVYLVADMATWGCHRCDCMVVSFITTYEISVYYHWSCEFETCSLWDVRHTTLCDSQWLSTDQWFSPGTLVSSTNKTDRHDITEILLKVALNTISHQAIYLMAVMATNAISANHRSNFVSKSP